MNAKTGFSMVELMVTMGIMSIIITAIYGVFASVNRTCTSNEVIAEVMQKMRTSLEFMEQDIRMAGLDPLNTADMGIVYADGTKLRFTADRNMDGDISAADLTDNKIEEQDLEDITYEYQAANQRLRQCLSEGTTNAWETVAEDVIGFQFSYLDADGNTIANPAGPPDQYDEIRTVQISMTVEQPASLSGPVMRTLTKRILCRNLGF
jgi:prepilin-type N-terminal cleavage/methylation domain-containing protein